MAMDGILLQFPSLDSNTRWLLVIAGVLTIVYVVMRPLRGKKKDPLARNASRGNLAQERAVERDMSNLLVELSQMSRQITAQLDTRTMKLELLIKEADERIAALQKATHPASDSRDSMSRELSSPAQSRPTTSLIDARYQEIYDLADQGKSAQEIASKLARPRGEIELILALRVPMGVA